MAVNALDPKVLAACVAAQVQLLRALLAAIADLDRALRTALGAHPKTAVLAAMPRIGQVNLAQVLAEVGPFRWAANTRAGDAPGHPDPRAAATAPPGRPRSTGRPAGAASVILRPSGS